MFDRVLETTSFAWSRAGGFAALAAVAATLAAPSPLSAQGGGQGQQGQMLKELREINRQLQPIRRKALKDSAVRAQQQELTAYIRSEMKSVDDSTAARVDRMVELESELRSARQAQDTAGFRAAMREMKKLNRATRPARKKVMSRPEVQKRIQAFREALRSKMRELSPKADSLMKRADSIQAELSGGMGGGSSGGSGG